MHRRFVSLKSKALLFAALIGICDFHPGWPQTASGTITGTVTDLGGAVVPNVQIVGQNRATGMSNKVQAGEDGNYTVPLLPVGNCEITATAPEFKSFHQTSLTLDVAQRPRIDITLTVGSVDQTVTVSSEAPALETEESFLGNVMEGHNIAELPMNGRQPFILALLVTGVQATSTCANGFADASNQGFSRLRMNGGPTTGNLFLLHGAMDTISAPKRMQWPLDRTASNRGKGD
jgi:hypothetical protein